jgi:hypothetical protein
MSSERSRLLTGTVLSAATCTAWSPKVRALGRALAGGLMATDDARIDTEPLIVAALADIEFPQASLLELLVCHWPATTTECLAAEPFTVHPRATGTPWAAGQRIWRPGDIGLVRPTLCPVLPSLLGTLRRHGLAAQSDNPGDAFGRTIRAMQQRFLSDVAVKQGSGADLGAVAGYAPAGDWLPTELGEEVLNALLEAGAEFGD